MTLGEQLKLKGVDITQGNIAKQNKNEQLFFAVENKNLQQIRVLLNSGVNVNTRDSYGYTPLMTAIENNDIKSCKLLVEYGAEINCKDNDGETPLIKAVLTESKIIVEFLIQKGACINETDELGETALMKAARADLSEIGNLLLMVNAKYDLINYEGQTARDIAIKTWGIKKENFFLRIPLIEEDLLLQKSIDLIRNILSNKKLGFLINISEVKERFEKKYNERITTDIIEKSLVSINEHFYGLDFNAIINDEKIILCPNKKIIIRFCAENDTIKHQGEHICLEDAKNFLFKYYDISSDFVSTVFFEKSQSLIYEIISVETISGYILRANWNTPMQRVETNHGTFIDNIPDEQHGFYGIASPGFDWSTLVGKRTTNVEIFRSRGYDWINYRE